MPNWCHSVLEITGPKHEIKSIADTELDFEKILPTPPDLIPETHDNWGMTEFQVQANLAIYGYESWYEWHLKNWGTKWNACNKTVTICDSKTIDVVMDTPWTLPMELLQKISSDHPNTTVHVVDCEEESGYFVGSCKILNGKIIADDIHKPTKEEMIERGMICKEDEEED